MNRKFRFLSISTCLMALILGACTQTPVQVAPVSLLPLPQQVEQTDSAYFVLSSKATIGYADKALEPAAQYLATVLAPATGYKLKTVAGQGTINLSVQPEGQNDGYRLCVEQEKVTINGDTYRGVINGIQTFRQLFPSQMESTQKVNMPWAAPCVTVTDAPQYAWRGLMLDVSRHFFDVDEVKQVLDLMAYYKLNKFHWHLTDDQGWRIEIKKYPLLTEKGAFRTFNNQDRMCLRRAAQENNPDYLLPEEKLHVENGDTLYGGFYTQDQIRDVIAYAAVRGIDVIPEIDMPGHILAAISNYDGVSCFEEIGWGELFTSPLCPGKDTALEFCRNVYDEVTDLFPYEYVHIGGDEVDKTNWGKCPDCQKRIHDEGLHSVEELQSWFIHHMESFINSKGKKMIGWDEIIEGGLSKTATVMWWRSWYPGSPKTAGSQGNGIIACPNATFYLDNSEDRNSIPNIYNFSFFEDELDDAQRAQVMGIQGAIWAEQIPSFNRMMYRAFPRLLAIAEKAWTMPGQGNYEAFTQRLANQLVRLNTKGITYRIPDVEGFHRTNAFIEEGKLELTCLDPCADIHYTTDGSEPTLESPRYEGPVTITESCDIKIRTFRPNGVACNLMETSFVKAPYTPAVVVAPSNPGLKAEWYEYGGELCDEITTAPFKGTYKIEDVVIPRGVAGKIGLVITGYLNVPADGIYTISLLSDDGSYLLLDGEKLIDNDHGHSPIEVVAQKALCKGYHPIAVRYFDHNGGLLHMTVSDESGNVIPFTNLYAY